MSKFLGVKNYYSFFILFGADKIQGGRDFSKDKFYRQGRNNIIRTDIHYKITTPAKLQTNKMIVCVTFVIKYVGGT